MAIAFRSKSETVGTATDVTVVEPLNAAQNDILFAVVAVAAGGASLVAPVTWTELYSAPASDFRFWIGWIRRGASAPSLTWTTGVSAYREAHVLCYSGVDQTGSPIDNANMNVNKVPSSANPDPPPVYAVDANAVALAIIIHWFGSSGAWGGPAGYTIRTRNTGGDDVSVAEKVLSAAGTEDPAAVTGVGGSATSMAATVTLRQSAPPAETQRFAPCLI